MPRALRPTLAVFIAALALSPAALGADEALDAVMYADPELPAARVVKVFPPRLLPLWLAALDGPEAEQRVQAANAIALGKRRGMPGLEAAVPPLLRALDRPDQHPTVRLAAAQALIALDAKEAAAALRARAGSDGVEMRLAVEPALVRWAYAPAADDWLHRLARTGTARRTELYAVQGLGAVRDPRGVAPLLELVRSPFTDPVVRLEAARALGTIRTDGLAPEARRLAAEKALPGSVAWLAAAALLRRHRDAEAVRVLQDLATGDDAAAAAAALDALTDADPKLTVALFPRVAANPDAAVRARAVEAYRRAPAPEHVTVAADLTDDPHPQVRVAARKSLLELARAAEHRPAVVREATRLVAADRWRAQEQAAVVLATLDHKPAAGRLVELLRSDRPEVFVAAAWGLRKLAVPDTLPAQLAEVERRWQRSLKPDPDAPREAIDLEVSHLVQSLGRARYAPATAALARFVPKQWNIGPESRAAAIWALGLVHEAAPPDRLVDGLLDRLTDDGTIAMEDLRVRRMAAVSLGRMKAAGAVESLRKYYPRKLTAEPFPNACGWALQRITGDPLPAAGTVEAAQRGWFLEPLD